MDALLLRLTGRALCIAVATVLLTGAGAARLAARDTSLEELRRVEKQVQEVVRQNLQIVVAVTDGIGYGSGVIVSRDGLVLTAGHVMITGGNDFRVIFPDGREVKAEPLGHNLNHDAGMLRLAEAGPWPFAEPGDISSLKAGDWCVCLGHSGGYELGRRPPVRAGRIVKFETDQLVTDCALIGGDSGGPLFDLSGRVIGIHSSIGSSVAENRHVAITVYRKYWDRMLRGERWGVLPELADKQQEEERASMGIRVDRKSTRAEILLVYPGRPAENAGLKPGDVVLMFDRVPVNDAQHLIDLIAGKNPDETVSLVVQREGEELSIDVTLGDSR
jgi:serine protease Do